MLGVFVLKKKKPDNDRGKKILEIFNRRKLNNH